MLKIILLGWIAGIACIGLNFIYAQAWLYGALMSTFVLFITMQLSQNSYFKHIYLKILGHLGLLICMFFIGYLYADRALESRLQQKERSVGFITSIVYIDKMGDASNQGIRQTAVKLNDSKSASRTVLFIPDKLLSQSEQQIGSLVLGRYYLITGLNKPIGAYANVGSFDQEKWFIQQNWLAKYSVQSIRPLSDAEVIQQGFYHFVKQQQGHWQKFILAAEQFRLDFRYDLKQQPLTHKALMLALLTGDRSLLDQDTAQRFQQFGISHLLAISGPHVLILAGFFTFLLQWIIQLIYPKIYLSVPRQILILLPMISLTLLYTAFVGFEIPALRTLLLLGISGLFIIARWQIKPFTLLVYTASLNLYFDPFAVLSAAFWLSYGACFILFIVYQQIQFNSQAITTSGFQQLRAAIKMLVITQFKIFIALSPLVILFFKQLSLISPLANIVAIPLLGALIVPLGILAAVVHLIIPSLGQYLFYIDDQLIRLLFYILDVLDHLFKPQLHHWPISPWLLLSLSIAVFILFLPKHCLPKSWGILGLLPLLLLPWVKRDTQLSVLDVGQGQAIFVQDPEQRILIDTGGYYDENIFSIGKRVVIPFLKEQGVTQLDRILLSHLDQDHSGALPAILESIPVHTVMANETLPYSTQAEFYKCHVGQSWQNRYLNIRVLSPNLMPDKIIQQDRNENSCVIYVEFLTQSHLSHLSHFLIMGDAGWQTEYQLLKNYPDLKVDVLILGHHGSKHSSSYNFLQHYRPKMAIASAGVNNRYGHPSEETILRLQDLHIPLYTTIDSGNIQFVAGKQQLEFIQYRQQRKWLRRP